jgi:hypothetical protein
MEFGFWNTAAAVKQAGYIDRFLKIKQSYATHVHIQMKQNGDKSH